MRHGRLDHRQVWAQYAAGQLPAEIGRSMGRPPDAIYVMIRQTGGICPALRVRSSIQLSLAEREEISRGLAAGISCRAIATMLGRAPSTITREINRNGGPGGYRALAADGAAWKASTRPKISKLAASPKLAEMVTERLKQRWSPQQIAGWLRRIHADEPSAVGVTRDFSTGRWSCRPKVPSTTN
jgi:DNA-binding CsgD family transcriptional regulator